MVGQTDPCLWADISSCSLCAAMCAVWIIHHNSDRLESVNLWKNYAYITIHMNMYGKQTDRPQMFYKPTMEGHWGEDNGLGNKTYFRNKKNKDSLQTIFGQRSGLIWFYTAPPAQSARQRSAHASVSFFLYHVTSVFGERITSCM